MATKTIPEQKIVTCDVCHREKGTVSWAKDARLTLRRHALDMYGSACADATVHFDLCDGCESKVSAAINEAARLVRLAAAPTEQEDSDA